MKFIYIYAVILSIMMTLPVAISAQITADAGPDKGMCTNSDNITPVILGGDPVAIGGTGPYTYQWEAYFHYQMGTFHIIQFASAFLNDTTVANPSVFGQVPNIRLTIPFTLPMRSDVMWMSADTGLPSDLFQQTI